jgi:SOS-response transcriptional repressor LexA
LRHGDVVLVRQASTARVGDVVIVRWADQFSVKRVDHADAGLWFVTGDNVFGSTDSRELGPAELIAIVRWRLWPRPGRVNRDSAV